MSKSFAVGNTVRFTHESRMGHSGSVQHKLYVVSRVEQYKQQDDLLYLNDGSNTISICADRVELVSEGALPFTTGDQVITATNCWEGCYSGYSVAAETMGLTSWARHGLKDHQTYTVWSAMKHEYNGDVVVAVEDSTGKQYMISHKALEKYVEPEPVPEYPVFKVGDRVRVKASEHGSVQATLPGCGVGSNSFHKDMDRFVGQVFKVGGITRDGYRMQGTIFGWMPQWLELYTATPLEEAQEEIERLKNVLDKKDKELLEVRTLIGQATEILNEI